MEHEVVTRRGWLSHEHFLDLLGTTNLIPGPNSVEMANHIGYRRAGWLGLLVAGSCFTLPAVLISAALAVGYVRYGTLPQVEPFLYGVKPVVLAVVFAAVWRLGRKALRSGPLLLIGSGVAAASLAGGDPIIVLLAGSLIGLILLGCFPTGTERKKKTTTAMLAGITAGGVARASKRLRFPWLSARQRAPFVRERQPWCRCGSLDCSF